MTLDQFLRDREIWQDNTIEEIRKRILFKASNMRKSVSSEKLVAIYGPPQIGKTTLILHLLGIAPCHRKQVYNTLRAGVTRGNSSTSTAIMYQQIDSEQYGVKFGEDSSDIDFCSESDLEKKIQDIRKKVENEKAGEEILHIYIPNKFFDESVLKDSGINIVDLPGEGSRNLKEKAHVDAMISKYLSLATVNIIACKANEIQSLQDLELPIKVDWRNMPHKYIIVITNSYGQGSIKKYFKIPINQRKSNFYDYVKITYEKNMKKILGSASQIEYFPIDIGDSLERLINNNSDKDEILNVTFTVASEIRKSIQKRHGNGLKSTMMDLKSYSSEYAEDNCKNLEKKIDSVEERIKSSESCIKEKQKIVQECEKKIDELQSAHEKYLKSQQTKVKIDVTDSFDLFKKKIEELSTKGKIEDKDSRLLSYMQGILLDLIEDVFKKYDITYTEQDGIAIYEEINMNVDMEAELGEKLCSGGLLSRKIRSNELVELSEQLFDIFGERLHEMVKVKIEKKIRKLESDNDDYLSYQQWKKECQREIEKEKSNMKRCTTHWDSLKKQQEEIEIRKNADMKVIGEYARIAKDEFIKYKTEVLEKIDSEEYPLSEKVYMLVYLCLIEKDYQSIIEME